MEDKRKLKSYVWHGGQCYFVSTIERDSSAMVGPPAPRFNESTAWEYDYETSNRGEMVAQEGSGPAFLQHFLMCEHLFKYGEVRETFQEELQWKPNSE